MILIITIKRRGDHQHFCRSLHEFIYFSSSSSSSSSYRLECVLHALCEDIVRIISSLITITKLFQNSWHVSYSKATGWWWWQSRFFHFMKRFVAVAKCNYLAFCSYIIIRTLMTNRLCLFFIASSWALAAKKTWFVHTVKFTRRVQKLAKHFFK